MSGCFPSEVKKCNCSCHNGGAKYMLTSNPPKPCCECEKRDKHESKCKCVACLSEQIVALTDMYKHLSIQIADFHDHKVLLHDFIKSANGRLEKSVDIQLLHTMRQTIETWQQGCEVLINSLQSKIGELDEIEHWKKSIMGNLRFSEGKPHKCPVCNGYGYHEVLCNGICVPGPECNSCDGKGIVWG